LSTVQMIHCIFFITFGMWFGFFSSSNIDSRFLLVEIGKQVFVWSV
jgi:hypothetical protein